MPNSIELRTEALSTASISLFTDMTFDSVNASILRPSDGKHLQSAVTKNLIHTRFWNEAINVFKNMTFDDNKGKISKPPCVTN